MNRSRPTALIAGVLLVACASGIALARKPAPPPADAAAARAKAASEIERFFDQAHEALRSARREEAVTPAQKAVAVAEQLRPSDELRIRTLSQAGALFWSVNRKDLAKPALMAAVRQIEAAPGPMPPDIPRTVFHMLGVIHRDEQRHEDAIPWFLRAVQVSADLPETTKQDAQGKYFTLASDLRSLAWAQCRANQPQAAEETDERRVAACARLPRQSKVSACRDGKRTCMNRWMSQSH